MKQIYLLVKVTSDKKYSPQEKINEYLKMKIQPAFWGSNHNLKVETIENIFTENQKNGYKKIYVLFLFSKEKNVFNYKAELVKDIRIGKIKNSDKIHIPKPFRHNIHKLWLPIKKIQNISKNCDYKLEKFRTLNGENISNINACSMARILKINNFSNY